MKKLTLIIFLCASVWTISGQETAVNRNLRSIETRDGNVFVGKVLSETVDSLILETEKLGILRFSKYDITSTGELKTITSKRGEFWLPNPQSSRYFWAPNGYGLRKGEAYYQNIWVLYNQVSVGMTDNFSIGAGMIPLFLFAGEVVPVWLVPKFSIPVVKEKFNIGTGAFLGTVIGEDTGIFGLLYGTGTIGSRDKNLSLGLAYGFAGGEWMGKPLINMSTLIRISSKSYFISENYILPVDGQFAGIFSFGGRSMIRKVGFDYSLWIPVGADIGSFFAVPFIGITIPLK